MGNWEVVAAKAHRILSVDALDRFSEGEILVCRMTKPVWTPMFAIAAGVIPLRARSGVREVTSLQ
jgi:phosphoenolpyruvate synthase/pyruvate phosphate dikinase